MQKKGPSTRPWRRGAAIALVAVASVLAFATVFAVWIGRQLLDTGNWTAASSQMLDEPAIRNETAAYLTDQLYANVDVAAEIGSALPPRAQFLAEPAAGLLRDRVEVLAREALVRPKVQELWENANRAAHETLLRVLAGGDRTVATKGGVVVLDLKALLADLDQRSGLGGRVGQALLAVLSLTLFGAALAIAPCYRRRAVRGYGVGLVGAGVAALAGAAWTGDVLVDSVARTAATEPAVRAVWSIYDTLLVQAATATIGYGVVLVGGAWLAGPTRWAVATRRVLAPYLREPWIAYGVLALIVLVVIVWWAPTPATRNPVTAAVLVALLFFGFEILRRQTAREQPPVIVRQAPPNGAELHTLSAR